MSVTVRANSPVKAAIAGIDDDAWTTVKYPDAIFDESTGTWISKAEVAEVPYTAFAAEEDRPGARPAGRAPDPDVHAEAKKAAGQGTLFDLWRFHAFFTTAPADTMDTVAADKTHRGHAIIEQVHADLKNSALAHLPSGKFTANAAWLVLAVIAFNLTRAAASLTAAHRSRKRPPRRSVASSSTSPPGSRPPRPTDDPAPPEGWPWPRGNGSRPVQPRRRPSRHGTS